MSATEEVHSITRTVVLSILALPEALRDSQHPHVQTLALQDGTTPLHLAAYIGKTAAIQLLLSSGASVHAQNCDGQTPLFEAAAAGHREAAELLLQSGANAGSDVPPSLALQHAMLFSGWGGKRDTSAQATRESSASRPGLHVVQGNKIQMA